MKKTYTNPELFVIALSTEDVITTSVEQNIWQPAGKDIDWGDYLKLL